MFFTSMYLPLWRIKASSSKIQIGSWNCPQLKLMVLTPWASPCVNVSRSKFIEKLVYKLNGNAACFFHKENRKLRNVYLLKKKCFQGGWIGTFLFLNQSTKSVHYFLIKVLIYSNVLRQKLHTKSYLPFHLCFDVIYGYIFLCFDLHTVRHFLLSRQDKDCNTRAPCYIY